MKKRQRTLILLFMWTDDNSFNQQLANSSRWLIADQQLTKQSWLDMQQLSWLMIRWLMNSWNWVDHKLWGNAAYNLIIHSWLTVEKLFWGQLTKQLIKISSTDECQQQLTDNNNSWLITTADCWQQQLTVNNSWLLTSTADLDRSTLSNSNLHEITSVVCPKVPVLQGVDDESVA